MLSYRALATGVIDVLPVPEGIQGKGSPGKPDSGLPRGPGRYRDGRLGLLEDQGESGNAFEAWRASGATEDQQPAGSRQGGPQYLPTRQGGRPATVLRRHGRVSVL